MKNDLLDKDAWVKEVSINFEKYIKRWVNDVSVGILEKKDVENATQKVLKYLATDETKRKIIEDVVQKYSNKEE